MNRITESPTKILNLSPGTHVCCLFSTEEDQRVALTQFLRQGLEQGEKVLYIADLLTADPIQGYLQDDGQDVEKHRERGQLTIIGWKDTGMQYGVFVPDNMIAFLLEEMEQALSEGYSALRVTSEMAWILDEAPGTERLIEYENHLNEFLIDRQCLILCQYDRRLFPPAILLDVLRTHPMVVIGSMLYENYPCIPPLESAKEDTAKVELNSWINNLAERKRTEDALRESGVRFRPFLDSATEIICLWDAKLNLITINKIGLMGLPPENRINWVTGNNIQDIIPDIRVSGRYDEYLKVLETGEPFFVDDFVPHPEFGDRIFKLQVFKVGDGLGMIATDVTERKVAEQKLRESEQRFKALNDSSPVGVFHASEESYATYVNDTLLEIFGLEREECLGFGWQSVMHPTDMDDIMERAASAIEEIKVNEGENRVIRPDGEVRWVRSLTAPMFAPDGRVLGRVGTIVDITEQVQAEQALLESEERFRSLSDCSPMGIFQFDEQGKAIFVNDAMLSILGRTRKECLDYGWRELIYPSDKENVIDRVSHSTKEKLEFRGENRILRSDGEVRWVQVRSASMFTQNGRQLGRVGMMVDVTDRVKSEIELRKHRDHLEELVQERTADLTRANERLRNEIAERKRIEEALRESEERVSLAMAIANLGSWDWNLETNQVIWSEKSYEIHGIEPGIPMNSGDVSKLIHPGDLDRIIEENTRAIENKVEFNEYEFRIIRPDGRIRWLRGNGRFFYDSNGKAHRILGTNRDITERKQAEKTLKESEEKFRTLAEQSPNMIFINKEGEIVYANHNAGEVLGYDRVEFYASDFDFFRLITPAYTEVVTASYRKQMQGEDVEPYECVLLSKDGEKINAILNTKLIDYEGGRAILATATDITKRVRVEKALKESEERYRILVETVPSGIQEIDKDGRILFTNSAYQKMYGYSQDELLGKSIFDFPSTQAGRDETREYLPTLVKDQPPLTPSIGKSFTKDGDVIDVRIDWNYKRDVEGKVTGFISAITDITEQLEAERALRESDELYRTLVNTSPFGVTATDLEGTVTFASQRALELHGYNHEEEVIGMSAFELIAPEDYDRAMENLRLTFEKGKPTNVEFTLLRKDGARFIGEIDAALILDINGEPEAFIATTRDITSRKENEQALQRYYDRLKVQHDIDQAILGAHSSEAIAEAALEHILRLVPCQRVSIAMFDWETNEGYTAFVRGEVPTQVKPGTRFSLSKFKNLINELRVGKPYIKEDIRESEYSPFPLDLLVAEGLRTSLSVPLLYRGELLGMFSLFDKKVDAFDPENVAITQEVARSLAIGMQQTRLIETERLQTQELKRANTLTAVLAGVAASLESTLDPHEVMETLGQELKQLSLTSIIGLLEPDEDGLIIDYHSISQEDAVELKKQIDVEIIGFRLTPESYPLWDTLIRRKHPHFSSQTLTMLRSLFFQIPKIDLKRIAEIVGIVEDTAYITLPLMVRERMIGILGMWGQDLRESDVQIYSVFARQIAVALEGSRLFDQVRVGREQLQVLSHRLVEAQETERRKIVRELHDEISQVLTALKLRLDVVSSLETIQEQPEFAVDCLERIRDLVDHLVDQVHDISLNLRPLMLDDLGLLPTLTWHFQHYREDTGVDVEFSHQGLDQRLPSEVEIATYRVVQEALTNIARHAGVNQVLVSLFIDPDALHLTIEDRGCGFDYDEVIVSGRASGLVGMRERAVLLGGDMEITTKINSGTVIKATLPLGE